MLMRWQEPLETVKARERFWNQPRVTVPIMLILTGGGALLCAVLGVAMVRFLTSNWHLPLSALVSAGVGGFFGLIASFGQRVRVSTQDVELRADDFSVHDQGERQMRYDQLRAYSLIHSTNEGATLRLLMMYPQTGRAFSIGIPATVTDEQIHACLRGRAPFCTIIDDEALRVE